MVPNIEYHYILLLGIVFYIRKIILLSSATKKHNSVRLWASQKFARLGLGGKVWPLQGSH